MIVSRPGMATMSQNSSAVDTQQVIDNLMTVSHSLGVTFCEVATNLNIAMIALYRAMAPIHRDLQHDWLVMRGVPDPMARIIADYLPRRWLMPMDVLYRDLQEGGQDAKASDSPG